MMKRIFFFTAYCSFFYVNGQPKTGFTVNGELKGLADNTWLYLIHNKDIEDGAGPDTVGRVQANAGRFLFTGRIPFEGEPYFIKIDTNRTKYSSPILGYITVFLENSRIKVKGDLSLLGLDKIEVIGSRSHIDYVSYMLVEDSLIKLRSNLEDSAATYDQTDTQVVSELVQRFKMLEENVVQYRVKWIVQHPNSLWTPRLILISVPDIEGKMQAYRSLSESAKKGKYGMLLMRDIDRENKTSPGTYLADFSLKSEKGDSVSLKGVCASGKITILNFWASWCGPCRAEIPDLKIIYDQFHEKGLNILGYSVDQDQGEWEAAVKKESLPWYNVRQTRDFATSIYGVQAIPVILVLNRSGEIIAKGLAGEDLKNKISEVLNSQL
jgi:thiol-disulfide isomerase/thioredoxin